MRIDRRFALLTAGVAATIVYGSLFPFDFYENARPLAAIWAAAQIRPGRMDIVANLLLYWPLGISLVLALRGWTVTQRVAAAVLCGTLLSASMESIQIFQPSRLVNLWEYGANTAGATLGALMGAMVGRHSHAPWLMAVRRRPFACLMLASWLVAAVLPGPGPASPLAWLEQCIVGLALALLIEALIRGDRPSSFGGAATLIAVLFTIHVVVNALRPFHFLEEPRPFTWVPFWGLMMSPRGSAVSVFCAKAFMYGTMVWAMVRAGWKIGRATAVSASLVLALRFSQVYLPGRSAEITDAIMVVGLAAVMKVVEEP